MSTMRYKANYKYQLVEPFVLDVPLRVEQKFTVLGDWVSVFPSGLMSFRAGYAWDGASGPTADTPNTTVPALIHDGLYQLMREGGLPLEYRATADRLFHNMLVARGMSRLRAWYWYQGVRLGAGHKALPGNGRRVQEAK